MNRNTLRATALAATLAASTLVAHATTIGFMAPLSGPQALVGQDQVDGFMLAVEQLGGKLGGQATSILKEDDQLKPEVGQQIAIEQRGDRCVDESCGNDAHARWHLRVY